MTASGPLIIRLHGNDNVVVARADILPGVEIGEASVATTGDVAAGHKIATVPIPAGEVIRKYDQIIGFATADIAAGELVHTHNVEVRDFKRDYLFCQDVRPLDMVAEAERATFQGYRRADGRVATRNYIGILTSVNCSAEKGFIR